MSLKWNNLNEDGTYNLKNKLKVHIKPVVPRPEATVQEEPKKKN